VADVFAEFCAAGLWPGLGVTLAGQLARSGIRGPQDVTASALAELPRVTGRRATRLVTSFIGAGQLYDVVELLVPQELPARWALRLVDALSDDAAAQLERDPWRLLVLPDATVAQADHLARALESDVSRNDPRRGRALVEWTLARFARDGDTAAPLRAVADGVRGFGVDGGAAAEAAIAAGSVVRVDDPAGSGEAWVARQVLAAAESDIASGLARLVRSTSSLADADAVRAVITDLDAVQAGAVFLAAEHGVSLLTGGPGTGKSRTVSAIVALCRAIDATIALAAPTGRAAKRMEELAGNNATTIHRLLGARPRADRGSAPGARGADSGSIFDRTADNPVEADVIVVDEASMLDVELAAALVTALADGTHLVIVGDPAQLPSIGPGRVLGDIIDSGTMPVTELRTLYRQTEGGAIARLATAVRGGDLLPVNDPTREVVIVPARASAEAAHRVVQLVSDSIPRVFGATADQIQVVTPVHRGPAGTQALNKALKAVLNPGTGTVRGFDVGDRVVATANHLDAEPVGFANGEVGTVVATGDNLIRVGFTGGEAEVSGKALADLLHGWAITVHRAQGSEWDCVVVALPPEAGSMLSRPLVYTALTRARRHLSVVNAAGGQVARAVRTVGSLPRRTRLTALLPAQMPASDLRRVDPSAFRASAADGSASIESREVAAHPR
jgi:exodeoxyribonuclease V alpha subunit